ncbi:hypothetical protein LDENG_00188670 [Lucifuga dentata]|nr:hypothetical protein LDENG_00188670 [Lucifuga dentata]
MEIIIHAFISSRLEYCNFLFTCLNKSLLNTFQTVQNATAQLLANSRKCCHVAPIVFSRHWFPVHFRINFKILGFTFTALHNQAVKHQNTSQN